MAIKTITRNDIGNAVYREMGLSRKESLEIVENIIQKNIASLENGQNMCRCWRNIDHITVI